jgi:hypothetical protein
MVFLFFAFFFGILLIRSNLGSRRNQTESGLNAASAISLFSLNFQKSETILQGIQMDCALPSTSILEILSPQLARPIRESAVFWSD